MNITRFDVETWIKTVATGEFHYTKVCGLKARLEPSQDNKLRGIMYELCHSEKPCCESIGRRDGYYRPIQEGFEIVHWQEANPNIGFPIILPFDLRKYVWIDPNTVIIFAGSKSAGKTGALYRVVALNMNGVRVKLLSNMEGGEPQMRRRFDAMDIEIPEPAPFEVLHITENFHDAITEPDTIYVIDYIDAPEGSDFYLIGAMITKVRRKLRNSVAVIGLQKPFGRDLAFGKEQTLKDAALYVAMEANKIKIVDAKVAANKKLHPKNMQWTFQFDPNGEGTNFSNIVPSYEEG